jgi:tungstate transport system ATP-binding protein
VRLENISKRFSGREVLSRINLEIREGELLTLLGPSGAGKTTLMRIINLFTKPSEGKLYFRDREVTRLSGDALLEVRRSMVMVFQKPVMFSGSVFDNVAYGLRIRGYSRAEIERRVKEALRLVGLEGYEERNARTLSGGEAQRVAFARAVVIQPELLLLDEPTTSLDPISEARVHSIIRKIKELGISVVLTTHKQHEALALGDRVAVLKDGKLQQVGTPQEVIYTPKTRFVAEFTGMVNIYDGIVEEVSSSECVVRVGEVMLTMHAFEASRGERICVGIRPEEVMLLRTDVPLNPRHKNVLTGVVTDISPQGSAMLRLRISSRGFEVSADVPRHVAEKMSIHEGGEVLFSLKTSCLRRLEE